MSTLPDPTAQPPAPSAKPDVTPQAEHMIPKSRLDEVLKRLDDAEKKAAALETAQQEADRKRLEEANEYKKLYETTLSDLTTLKPKAEQVESYEKTLQEILEAQVAELPDEFKDVVPDGLSTKQKLDWLAKNKSKFMKAEPFDIGAGKRGNSPDKKVELTAEEKAFADQFGIKHEDYAKQKR